MRNVAEIFGAWWNLGIAMMNQQLESRKAIIVARYVLLAGLCVSAAVYAFATSQMDAHSATLHRVYGVCLILPFTMLFLCPSIWSFGKIVEAKRAGTRVRYLLIGAFIPNLSTAVMACFLEYYLLFQFLSVCIVALAVDSALIWLLSKTKFS